MHSNAVLPLMKNSTPETVMEQIFTLVSPRGSFRALSDVGIAQLREHHPAADMDEYWAYFTSVCVNGHEHTLDFVEELSRDIWQDLLSRVHDAGVAKSLDEHEVGVECVVSFP